MRSEPFVQGRRNGIKACVSYLHALADTMNDPHARSILNAAAFGMGVELKGTLGPLHASDCALHNEPAYAAGPCDCGAAA